MSSNMHDYADYEMVGNYVIRTHRSDPLQAMAIAATGGCLVLTCPPEHCEISGASGGTLRVFYQAAAPDAGVAGVRVL